MAECARAKLGVDDEWRCGSTASEVFVDERTETLGPPATCGKHGEVPPPPIPFLFRTQVSRDAGRRLACRGPSSAVPVVMGKFLLAKLARTHGRHLRTAGLSGNGTQAGADSESWRRKTTGVIVSGSAPDKQRQRVPLDVSYVTRQTDLAGRQQKLPACMLTLKVQACIIASYRDYNHGLDYSTPIKAKRVRFPAGSPPDSRMWEPCRTVPLVGGSNWIYSVFPVLAAPYSPRFTLIDSQDLDGNTARLARRSDEALGVLVSVARIAPSLLDRGRAGTSSFACEALMDIPTSTGSSQRRCSPP
ncbi:hypothetical protein PR048_001185 [Dryococelus australis]|uniref:Uncharacterized protein n=1 Tax=Dryococelus australis TaxID=614101 RepID=A0ABQ9IGR9_9NEOP|nr:hypothetical protein PR048_001185 [Dryococelus australis]